MNGPDGLTTLLAGGVGGYLLLSAAGILTRAAASDDLIRELRASRALTHLTGAVAFFVGGSILLIGPGFGDWLSGLLTLTAIWWLAEGSVMLAAPVLMLSRSGAPTHFRRMNLFAIPVGIALIAGSIFYRLTWTA